MREALTRLSVESLVLSIPNRGFFAKMLTTEEMNARYEFAFMILQRALLTGVEKLEVPNAYSVPAICSSDSRCSNEASGDECQVYAASMEAIFLNIAELSGNPMMVESIKGFNEQTHYVRIIDISKNSVEIDADMRALTMSLLQRDANSAIENLKQQLDKKRARMDILVNEGNVHSLRSAQP